MRRLREPFVAAPPGGAAIRTRLRVTAEEHDLLLDVGALLGRLRSVDLVRLLDHNTRPSDTLTKADRNQVRAWRKRDLTAMSSSRIANSITRSNNDLWRLAWRNLHAQRHTLTSQIDVLEKRCAIKPGERVGGVRGYRSAAERSAKQQRLRLCRRRLAGVEDRIAARRPSICVGGKALARHRHNLDAADLTETAWRARWDAARAFLTFIGTAGERFGNDTLSVDPDTGQVTLSLPAALAHRSNTGGPRRWYRFAHPVEFAHRDEEWAARAAAREAIRYRLRYDPEARKGRGVWYLDASWATNPDPLPYLEQLRSHPTVGVDLNAGWIAAHTVDASGNPLGRPVAIPIPQQGPRRRRLGQLRAAITELLDTAEASGCLSVTIEDLDFADARDTGRETLGRGPRGKRFRRQIANIATAQLRDNLTSMAHRRGIAVIAVDPAYTSKWARQHNWQQTLHCSSGHRCSSHHGAAVVIARRGLGHRARRAQGQQSMADCSCPDTPAGVEAGRAAGVRGRGRSVASRTPPRQPHTGRKTGGRRRASATGRRATPFGATLRAPPQAHSPRR